MSEYSCVKGAEFDPALPAITPGVIVSLCLCGFSVLSFLFIQGVTYGRPTSDDVQPSFGAPPSFLYLPLIIGIVTTPNLVLYELVFLPFYRDRPEIVCRVAPGILQLTGFMLSWLTMLIFVLLQVRIRTRWNLGGALQHTMSNNDAFLSYWQYGHSKSASGKTRRLHVKTMVLSAYRGAYVAPFVKALYGLIGSGALRTPGNLLEGDDENDTVYELDVFGCDEWATDKHSRLQPEDIMWFDFNCKLELETIYQTELQKCANHASIRHHVHAAHTDYIQLPFKSKSLDVVVLPIVSSLPFLSFGADEKPQEQALVALFLEVKRVLRGGGLLLTTVFSGEITLKVKRALASAGFLNVTIDDENKLCLALMRSSLLTASVAVDNLAKAVEEAGEDEGKIASGGDSGGGPMTIELREGVFADEEVDEDERLPPSLLSLEQRKGGVKSHPRDWFPAGWLWRLRDLLALVTILLFVGLFFLVVDADVFHAVATVPNFVPWNQTFGTLLLGTVTTMPFLFAAVVKELSVYIGGEAAEKFYEYSFDGVEGAAREEAAADFHDDDDDTDVMHHFKATMKLGRKSSFESGLLSAQVDDASVLASRARGESFLMLDSTVIPQPMKVITAGGIVRYWLCVCLRDVVLILTVLNVFSWLPSFLVEVVLVHLCHASNTVASIANILFIFLFVWILRPLYTHCVAEKAADEVDPAPAVAQAPNKAAISPL